MSTVLANTVTAVGGGGSTVKVANNATYITEGGADLDSNLVQGLSKGWAIYTSASTFTIQNSFNCSGLTDRGTGDGRVNFTNGFQDQHGCQHGVAGARHTGNGDANSGYINVVTLDSNHQFEDGSRTTGIGSGDLA